MLWVCVRHTHLTSGPLLAIFVQVKASSAAHIGAVIEAKSNMATARFILPRSGSTSTYMTVERHMRIHTTHTHTHIQTYIHTYIYTYTHTHTSILLLVLVVRVRVRVRVCTTMVGNWRFVHSSVYSFTIGQA